MSEASPSADSANAAMRRYWNEVAGPRWVERAEIQEARNIEVAQILLREAHAAAGERVLDVGCGPGATALPLAASVGPSGHVTGVDIEVAQILLREAHATTGERVLDVGCGPGATALPLAASVGPSGHVTGVDIAEPMLGLLRRRIAEQGIANLTPLLADAQTHAFAPASFDLLTSRFGVMFFADHLAAFRNLGGALRPGGRLCMAVWAGIAANVHWRIPFDIAVRHVGPPKPQPAHAPGPMALGDPDYVRGVLSGAGFTGIAIEPTPFHVIGKSAASEAEHAGMLGPSGRLLDEQEADEATRRAVVQETEAAFAAQFGGEGTIRLPGTFLLLQAQRPS